VTGLPSAGVLVKLKDSKRSCALIRSVIWKDLCAARSRLKRPGPRKMFLPASPNLYGAFGVNAAVLNHSCNARVGEVPIADEVGPICLSRIRRIRGHGGVERKSRAH